MSELVRLSFMHGVGVITIENPPVNALSPGVPEGIAQAVEKIDQGDATVGAVLIGGNHNLPLE